MLFTDTEHSKQHTVGEGAFVAPVRTSIILHGEYVLSALVLFVYEKTAARGPLLLGQPGPARDRAGLPGRGTI